MSTLGPRVDGVTLLTVYTVLLFAVPSRLTISALGGAGSLALVMGLGCGVLWVVYHAQRPRLPAIDSHPVRVATFTLIVAFGLSYIAAMTRPIDAVEKNSADLGLVALASWAGVLLYAHDCVPSLDRLVTLARRIVAGGSAVAAIGLIQWATGQQLIDRIRIPGLTTNSNFTELTVREGFNRPMGTALHPIEFGAVITMILPLALALALSDTGRGWIRRWAPVLLLTSAVTFSISRSAILCTLVGVIVFMIPLPGRIVRALGGSALAFGVLVFLLVPGLSGTMLGLFSHAGEDPSIASRTGSYELAGLFFERAPLFGRGFGTFLPKYRIFDNQYLLSLIEVGIVGVLALFLLLAASVISARRAALLSSDPRTKMLAHGLLATTCAAATGLAVFDGFSFPMGTGAMFLLLGLSGAAYRLERTARRPGQQTPHEVQPSQQAAIHVWRSPARYG